MHARVVTFQGDPAKMQEMGTMFPQRVLPVLKQQRGFKGVTVLLDRERGKALGISLWESADAADAAMAVIGPMRQEQAATMGSSAPPAEGFEVIFRE